MADLSETPLLSRNRGFTLIDMSILVAVLGILAATLLTSNKVQRESLTVSDVNAKLDRVQQALDYFYTVKAYLPCPASRILPPTDVNYLVGDCATAPSSGNFVDTSTGDIVRIGTLPTRSLGLPDSYAQDQWGNSLLYAMNKGTGTAAGMTSFVSSHTSAATAIHVWDASKVDKVTGNGNIVAYVIASHGPDGNGAYSPTGKTVRACSSGTPGTSAPLDAENCNGDVNFIDTAVNDNPGASNSAYYYDIIRWKLIASLGK